MWYPRYTGIVFFSLAVLILTGCQSLTGKPQTAVPQQLLLEYAPKWSAQGKISLRYNDERTSASFDWEQQHDNYVIHLFGPFGQGSTWIRRTSKGVSLDSPKTGYHRADTAEALMEQFFGWQVPVSGLQYWIRALAAPDAEAQITEEIGSGRLYTLEQDGWSVAYSEPQTVKGWQLPRRLVARRDGMEVIMVVKNWDLPPVPTGLQ